MNGLFKSVNMDLKKNLRKVNEYFFLKFSQTFFLKTLFKNFL